MTAPYQLLPDLTAEEFAALKADIADRGVLVPVEYDESGHILDGHHRVRACTELGIAEWPRITRSGMTEVEKRAHVRALNLHRRHLSVEQRRALIADAIREAPERSDRQIAASLQVSHPTVSKVRSGLETAGEVEPASTTIDTLGREQPRRRIPVHYIQPPDRPRDDPSGLLLVAKRTLEEYPTKRGASDPRPARFQVVTAPEVPAQANTPHEVVKALRAIDRGFSAVEAIDPRTAAKYHPANDRDFAAARMMKMIAWMTDFVAAARPGSHTPPASTES